MIKNKHLIVLLVLLGSSYFLYTAFKDIHFAELLRLFKTTQVTQIVLWFLIFLIATALRTYRWRYLISDQGVSLKELFHALNIGNFASLILPFRAGEFIRPLMLSKSTNVSFTNGLISVVIERVSDVLGMFIVFCAFVKDTNNMPQLLVTSANSLAVLAGTLTLGLVLARIFPDQIITLLNAIIRILKIPSKLSEPVNDLSKKVIDGLGSIKSLPQLAIIFVTTVIIWLCYAISFSVILTALDKPFDITIGAVTAVFVALAIAAPNTPGFLLTFEMGVSAALAVFAYHGEFSLAFALIAHAVQIIGTIFLGIFSLWSKGLSLKQIKSL